MGVKASANYCCLLFVSFFDVDGSGLFVHDTEVRARETYKKDCVVGEGRLSQSWRLPGEKDFPLERFMSEYEVSQVCIGKNPLPLES